MQLYEGLSVGNAPSNGWPLKNAIEINSLPFEISAKNFTHWAFNRIIFEMWRKTITDFFHDTEHFKPALLSFVETDKEIVRIG